MKVIIIEGPDNVGKNTIIRNLIDNYDSVKIIHCHKPSEGSPDPLKEMTKVYYKHADDTITDYRRNAVDAVIFNRFYFDEWVYGQMYREENRDDIKEVIQTIENYLLSNIPYEDIYYIQLISTSVDLLNKIDDGRSLSGGDKLLISVEHLLFLDALSNSSLKKAMIRVNDQESFRPMTEIMEDVNDFISDKPQPSCGFADFDRFPKRLPNIAC